MFFASPPNSYQWPFRRRLLTIFSSALLLSCPSLYANTPAEMADFSLQQLLALSTDEENADKKSKNTSPWQVSLLYKRMKFDGYRSGTQSLSNDEVLFDGIEPRTSSNFPVLPTTIIQQAYIANLTYQYDSSQSLSVNLPLIKQSTDHISIVPGYDEFNISTSGLGDISAVYQKVFKKWSMQQLSYSIGVSIPTGSIDEQGDTPREAGNQQLPFTMQLGSGTWDIPLAMSYLNAQNTWLWGTDLVAKIHIGKNDRQYRLGDRYGVTFWTRWRRAEVFQPIVKLNYQHWERINGRDDETTVAGPFPFPAGITNPDNFGGDKIVSVLGSAIKWQEQELLVTVSVPLYQSLNGVQPKEHLGFSVQWRRGF